VGLRPERPWQCGLLETGVAGLERVEGEFERLWWWGLEG